jgi:hypothetical protein
MIRREEEARLPPRPGTTAAAGGAVSDAPAGSATAAEQGSEAERGPQAVDPAAAGGSAS